MLIYNYTLEKESGMELIKGMSTDPVVLRAHQRKYTEMTSRGIKLNNTQIANCVKLCHQLVVVTQLRLVKG